MKQVLNGAGEELHYLKMTAHFGTLLEAVRVYRPLGRWRIRERNSERVSSSLRKQPSMEEVTAAECCFSTPRIIMHRWRASITTATPWGSITFWMVSAICVVKRS